MTSLPVYVPSPSSGYELCHPTDPSNFERINVEVNGVPRGDSWSPMVVEVVRDDEGRDLAESDAPWLGSHALILRKKAITVLEPELTAHGELLELRCSEADLWIYNPTRILNALDEAASSVLRFSTGRIMRVNNYAFRADAIGGAHIFKIPNLRVSPTFVSEEIVRRWESAGLKGLDFQLVWRPS